MTIARLEVQPNFPTDDITDHNAAMMEFLLRDSDFVESTHEHSEELVRLYKIGHSALKQLGIANFPLLSHIAFSHGVSAYETMAAAVRPATPNYDIFQITEQVVSILDLMNDNAKTMTWFVDARDRFISEQPNAAEAIKSASTLHDIPLSKDYVLFGAAVERQLEMDILNTAASA